jgi:signal transduction histidine kinase/streptogramin lyase
LRGEAAQRVAKLAFAGLLLLSVAAAARVPERSLAQYTHRTWSEESDAPRPVIAIAQGRRGYLWVAAGSGLYRFDGMSFELISSGIDPIEHGAPSAILVRGNGDIWTNFERSRRFAVYRDGKLSLLNAPPAPDRVQAMQEARDGTVWMLTERIGLPLLRYRAGKWAAFGTSAEAPLDNPFSMVVTSAGAVWVSFTGSVARLEPGSNRFETMRQSPRSLGRLSLDPEERIWLSERTGTFPITGPGGRGKPPRLRHPYATDRGQIRGWPRFDREGNLWIATYYNGLQRVSRPDPRGAPTPVEANAKVEQFGRRDGLSSNVTRQVFQDLEGNIWAGTENGLDRFWPASFRYEPELTNPAAFGDLLLSASDGSVYIGQASTVYRARPGGAPEPIFRTEVEPRTLCEAPDGAIWIGIDRDVVIWRDGKMRRLESSAPVTSTIYDCAFDAHGDYWVTASTGGMARFRNGRWDRPFGPAAHGFAPKSMAPDARGRLLVQWTDDLLARLGSGKRTSIPIPVGGQDADEVVVYPTATGAALVGGSFGLARLGSGPLRHVSPRQNPLFSRLHGIVQTPEGETWMAGAGGIIRMRSIDLEKLLDEPARQVPMQRFGAADGLKSLPHDHSRRAIVRGGDGRLWIATQTGTAWLDPDDIARSRSPPAVSVASLTADKIYRDPVSIRLPPGTRDIRIDFAVISFSNPRAVRVRYMIEGQDAQWVDAGTRRQAFYTNLSPGTYRFRLVAATEGGIWNRQGATLDIEIPPTFVQSWRFAALCAAAALAALWLLYKLRVARVAARIRNRFAERLGERERIARELHDTLLQSVQGLILRFQSVANKMPAGDQSRAQLEAALKRADDVIAEGRDRVHELRLADRPMDLPALIEHKALEADFDPSTSVRIIVEGKARPLHPLVSAEVAQVASEALLNAARHAGADKVEVILRFGQRELALEVRDNGIGLPVELLANGHKPGHFGLIGMRERAERIGGLFVLESRPGQGSAMTLSVPAKLAFVGAERRGFKFSIFPWKKGPNHA